MANCHECHHNEEFNTRFVWCAEKKWHVDPKEEQDCKEFKSTLERRLSPSEAIMGFAQWLVTRNYEVAMSCQCDRRVVKELVDAYCALNGLEEPKSGWWFVSKDPGSDYMSDGEKRRAHELGILAPFKKVKNGMAKR